MAKSVEPPVALDRAESGRGADDRVRSEGHAADRVRLDASLADRPKHLGRGEVGSFGEQGGLLRVEVEAALPPRGQREVAEHQGFAA